MRVLLDTHIFIWWNGNVDLLSPTARSICEDDNNTLVLSLASIWEMQIKSQLGKLAFSQPLSEIVKSQERDNGIEILPINAEHVYALQDLPAHHRDPFDRLLITQANVERIPLLTFDTAISQYDVELLG